MASHKRCVWIIHNQRSHLTRPGTYTYEKADNQKEKWLSIYSLTNVISVKNTREVRNYGWRHYNCCLISDHLSLHKLYCGFVYGKVLKWSSTRYNPGYVCKQHVPSYPLSFKNLIWPFRVQSIPIIDMCLIRWWLVHRVCDILLTNKLNFFGIRLGW